VHVYRMVVLGRPVSTSLIDSGGIVEVTSSHCFLNGYNFIGRTFDNYFDSITQLSQLISDVADSRDRFELNEVLHTPLLRVACLGPLFEYVEKGEVISAGFDECLVSLFGVDLLVLGSVKERTGFLQH